MKEVLKNKLGFHMKALRESKAADNKTKPSLYSIQYLPGLRWPAPTLIYLTEEWNFSKVW